MRSQDETSGAFGMKVANLQSGEDGTNDGEMDVRGVAEG